MQTQPSIEDQIIEIETFELPSSFYQNCCRINLA